MLVGLGNVSRRSRANFLLPSHFAEGRKNRPLATAGGAPVPQPCSLSSEIAPPRRENSEKNLNLLFESPHPTLWSFRPSGGLARRPRRGVAVRRGRGERGCARVLPTRMQEKFGSSPRCEGRTRTGRRAPGCEGRWGGGVLERKSHRDSLVVPRSGGYPRSSRDPRLRAAKISKISHPLRWCAGRSLTHWGAAVRPFARLREVAKGSGTTAAFLAAASGSGLR